MLCVAGHWQAGIAALERRLDSQHGVAAGRGATSSSPHRPSSIGDDVRALGERHEYRMVSLEEALTVERQQRESLANVVRILADSSDGHIAELEASVHRQLVRVQRPASRRLSCRICIYLARSRYIGILTVLGVGGAA
jgi:hypothetical protein